MLSSDLMDLSAVKRLICKVQMPEDPFCHGVAHLVESV